MLQTDRGAALRFVTVALQDGTFTPALRRFGGGGHDIEIEAAAEPRPPPKNPCCRDEAVWQARHRSHIADRNRHHRESAAIEHLRLFRGQASPGPRGARGKFRSTL